MAVAGGAVALAVFGFTVYWVTIWTHGGRRPAAAPDAAPTPTVFAPVETPAPAVAEPVPSTSPLASSVQQGLPGTWSNDTADLHTVVVFAADGTFSGRTERGGATIWTFSGRWAVERESLVWIYLKTSRPLQATEEYNPIVSFDSRELRLHEVNGETSTWTRTGGADVVPTP